MQDGAVSAILYIKNWNISIMVCLIYDKILHDDIHFVVNWEVFTLTRNAWQV